MPDHRPTYADPAAGGGAQRLDQVVRNRESHQELMRQELEIQHLAREGQPPKPSLIERARGLFRR
jgi:hypothetical protein